MKLPAVVGALLCVSVAFCLRPGEAHANGAAERKDVAIPRVADSLDREGRGDGVYGRFDGDLAFSLGAGVEFAPVMGAIRPGALLTARIYQTAGVFAGWHEGIDPSDPLTRTLALGMSVEPLFLLRWSADKECGLAFWDLTLDSLSISAAVQLPEARQANLGDRVGLLLGLGAGFPLQAEAPGAWLRLRGNLETTAPGAPTLSLWAHLEWQWLWAIGLFD